MFYDGSGDEEGAVHERYSDEEPGKVEMATDGDAFGFDSIVSQHLSAPRSQKKKKPKKKKEEEESSEEGALSEDEGE